jgi:hypothetical protein
MRSFIRPGLPFVAVLWIIHTVTPAIAQTPIQIGGISYLLTYRVTDVVNIYAGVDATLRVAGAGIARASIGTVIFAVAGTSTQVSGFTATKVGSGGLGPSEFIDLRITAKGPVPGRYDLRFPLNGFATTIRLRLNQRGTVTGIRQASTSTKLTLATFPTSTSTTSTTSITTVVSEPLALLVTGTGLSDAQFAASEYGALLADVTISNRTATSLTLTFTPRSAKRSLTISADKFFSGPLPPASCAAICRYGGSASVIVTPVVDNAITAMSALVVANGAPVTVSGRNLAPDGYTAGLFYYSKYSRAPTRFSATASATSVTFSARSDADPDSIFIEYTSAQSPPDVPFLAHTMLKLPRPLYVRVPPVIQRTDTLTENRQQKILLEPTGRIRGVDLESTAEVFPAGTTDVKLVPTRVTFAGQTLAVQSIRRLFSREDEIVVAMPKTTGPQVGTLTVTTEGGTASVSNVLFLPRPVANRIEVLSGSGTRVALPPGSTLRRGTQYFVVGSNLSVPAGTGGFSSPDVRIPGATANTSFTIGVSPLNEVAFSFPTIATVAVSGALTVRHLGGVADMGTYTVAPPIVMPAIASASATPNPIIGGSSATVTVAFASALPSGTDSGFIQVSVPQTAQDVVPPLPSFIRAATNPLIFQLPTRQTSTPRSVTLSIAAAPGTASSFTATQLPLTVVPLLVTGLTLSKTTVPGGTPLQATVTLNASPGTNAAQVQVLSSNAGVASVPPQVSTTGSSATFAISTTPVAASSTVTISVALGGVTQTATLTVTPPVVTNVVASRSSMVSFDTSRVTVTLDRAPIAPLAVTVASSDTTVLKVLGESLNVTTQTATVRLQARLVTTPRTVTITASTPDGQASTVVTVQPLTLTMTLSPASVGAGIGTTATVTMNTAANAPAPMAFTNTISSSDSTVAFVTSTAVTNARFANGQTVVVFPVSSIAPQGQIRTVTITYQLTLSGFGSAALNPLLPRATATLTVNP